jgi:hypothetical protein
MKGNNQLELVHIIEDVRESALFYCIISCNCFLVMKASMSFLTTFLLKRIRILIVKCLIVVLLVQFGCRQKSHGLDTVKPKDMPEDSVKLISKLWKADSLGCSQLRDPRKIKRLIKQVDESFFDINSCKCSVLAFVSEFSEL